PPSELIEEEPHRVSARASAAGARRRRAAAEPIVEEPSTGRGAAGAAGAAACCGIAVLHGAGRSRCPTDTRACTAYGRISAAGGAPAGITGSPRPSADIRESVDRSSLRWHARQGRERTGPPGPGGPTRRPPHTPLGRASMTMTRRTLAVLTAGAVPALGLAAAAQAVPP